MNRTDLDTRLRQLNDFEKELLNLDGRDVKLRFSDNAMGPNWRITSDKLMLKDEEIAIHKHDRFVDFDRHNHDYMEMMFVYSGEIHHVFDDREVIQKKGEILLMDLSVSHSIKAAGEGDIAIDFLMKRDFFDTFFLRQIGYNDMMTNFVVNAIYSPADMERYLYFRSGTNKKLYDTVLNMLGEFYDQRNGSDVAIRAYMLLLFNELIRDYHQYLDEAIVDEVNASVSVDIVAYIEEHYKSITLKSMAQAFNYNPDYLGKQIKRLTGDTLSGMVKKRKLKEAAKMLRNTDQPVMRILEEVNYSNASYFYKLFKEAYGMTPDEYRQGE